MAMMVAIFPRCNGIMVSLQAGPACR